MRKIINKLKLNKPEVILFLFSFFYLLVLGVTLSYNLDFSNNYNLLFNSDTARVIIDSTIVNANHYRIDVHPLYLIIIQPVVLLLSGITMNKMLSIVILSAFSSSLSVLFIYKILSLIKKDKKTNLLISLIYLFSFSNIIYTAGIETYNFASLFLIILVYYVLKNNELDKYKNLLLVVLGVFSLAFTITNFIVFLIILFMLFINKKINIKDSIKVVLITILCLFGFNMIQKVIWPSAPLVFKNSVIGEAKTYSKSIGIKNVLKNDYYNSLIGSNIDLIMTYGDTYNNRNIMINFINTNIFNILIISILYSILVFLIIRNFKKNKFINISLLLILLFNTLLHIVYGNDSTFLYSLHFLYLIILLLGININLEKSTKIKKYINIFLIVFLIIQILTNNYLYLKTFNYSRKILNSSYIMSNIGAFNTILLEILIISIILILIISLIYIIKLLIKEENKDKKLLLVIVSIVIIILNSSIFIHIENVPNSNRLFIFKLNNTSTDIEPITKLDILKDNFKNHFKDEINDYSNYKTEYQLLKNEYNVEEINGINWNDYYYFGMGNRKKLLYRNNSLIDISSSKEIYTFKEKEHLIVPNRYMVLIETIDNEYIKIYEDSEGVHFSINDKDTIIEGTNNHIDLYNFDNQKYQNIKKVLYSEILFNIKDSKIYPNIIVYDKPWYRDAAIVSMVLKNTNNTNLITEWVNSIEDIYDVQSDIREPDNLGELLYILSTQEERNEELIDKIVDEANRLADENPNGYYIFGKTDYSNEFLYQNLWYKLGIESVGRDFYFELDTIPKDNYSAMCWWSNYTAFGDNEGSIEYPYLTAAKYHKLRKGRIIVNSNNYPLSWEKNASKANYDNYLNINVNDLAYDRISELHSWSAGELLLLLLDDSGNLNIK